MNSYRRAGALERGFTLVELLVAMFIAALLFAMGYGAINQGVKNHTELQEQQARLLELQTAVRVITQDLVQIAPRPVRQPVGSEYYPAVMSTQTGSGLGTSTTSQPGTQLGGSSSSQLGGSSSQLGGSSSSQLGGSSSQLGGSSSSQLGGSSSQLGGSSSSQLGGSSSSQLSSSSARTSSAAYAQFSPNASGQLIITFTRAGWTNPNGVQRAGMQRVAYYFDKGTLRREHWLVLDPTQTSPTVKRDLLTHVKSVSVRFFSTAGWDTQWPRNQQVPAELPTRPMAIEVTLETEDWGTITRLIELPG